MDERAKLRRERWRFLRYIHDLTETPLVVLSFVWLALLVAELTGVLPPALQVVTYGIWALFVANFVVEIVIAPDKWAYFRHNWITAISLLLPALRILRVARALRVLRAARAARSVRLLRILTSVNRGMRATGRTLARRGVGYVMALTTIVLLAGAAGMRYFEPAFESYGETLWWTAMILTTMGTEAWPKTTEGRILCWLLSLYAFAIFGYITAAIASYLVGSNVRRGSLPAAELESLRTELRHLRTELERRPVAQDTAAASSGS